MRSLRCMSAEALVSHPQLAREGLGSVAHDLYPLLFRAGYLLEQPEVVCAVLGQWPLEEFRLRALLGPSTEHPEDLRDRACRTCLEACVQGLVRHVRRSGQRRLRVADLTGLQDVQEQNCPCGRALGRWGRTQLLARTCCELQAAPCVAGHPVQVLADLFVTDGNFEVVVQALQPASPAPLQLCCPSVRADSLSPEQLLHVLHLAGPESLHKLEVVHNVRLHAGHVQQLLAQVGFPQLASLTLPTRAFDMPQACSPTPDSQDALLTSIAGELGRMTHLTELSLAFSTLTGKVPILLSPLRTPLRTLDLAHCALSHTDMAFLADCIHATHLEVLDLSGHSLIHLFPSTFFKLLNQAAATLRVLTLEECGIADSHVGMMILGLSPCSCLQEFRFLGNPLSAQALRRLFAALCELPRLRCIEFPVPRDCYPEDTAYPQDEPALSRFDRQKYAAISEELHAVLLRAQRDDIQACTPLHGSFDPDVQETSEELGAFLLQAFRAALDNFSRVLRQME
ncbi:leucine-rich repeat-containing protein 14B isoform X2 [Ochotona princeps]|uniref:leucine-rich repeat-containing protein 14B isoform X2 n=1 Tax=Ochotona princeps TaxID=9978 RepID=UPI002714E9F1|nr:leucine-rich repeat-containing protein 14B isoform X2 [Ochotona princeps]